MFVNNKQTRGVSFSSPSGALVQLMPGISEISDEDAGALKSAIAPLKLEETGLIVFGETKTVGQGETKRTIGKTLADLKPEEAEALILETNDVVLLNTWKKSEKRDEVRLAIVNRLEFIKNYKPGEDEQNAEA